MRKGDHTRQQIVQVAERLFCAKGYDETSVQDILDEIHGSKGGFYHHFDSKEDLLREICRQRATASAERTRERLDALTDPMGRLNLVLREAMPFMPEDLTFMCMLMPILNRTESAAVRVGYQDAIAEAYAPLLRPCVEQLTDAGTLRPVTTDITAPALTLLNDGWYRAALLFIRDIEAGRRTEPAALLEILDSCRRCLEALLDAPYGSVELISLEAWSSFAEEALRRMRWAKVKA